MSKQLIFLFFIGILISCNTVRIPPGKEYSSDKNRAIKKFESARQYLQKYQNVKAKEELRKAIRIDDEFVEPWVMLAQIHEEDGNDSLALKAYEEAVDIDPQFFLPAHFKIGELYFEQGKYKKAIESLKYYDKHGQKSRFLNDNQRYLENCRFAIESKKNPVPFDPENLGENVNSQYDEYINSMSVDEQFIIFTVKQPFAGREGQKEVEDFYYASRDSDTAQWNERKKMSRLFNTAGNEGAMYISPDRSFLVFAACYRPDGYGSCDLYISYKNEQKWTKPVNMGEKVNSRKWDSHPTIASDNKTIYFVSTRNGGEGKSDIWKTTMLEDGTFSKPENLGRPVNSSKDEYYPFIHPDNNTLYFSSSGHTGMGGLDFFMTQKEDGEYHKPQNLGYPINTHHDELGLQVNAAGNLAFISTDRLQGYGRFDIYSFDLPEMYRPDPVTYMKGIVFDQNNNKKLRARFELIDLESEEVITNAYSDESTGEFLLSIPTDRNYALNVKKEDYLFYSETFELKGVHTQTEPYEKDIPLKPIEVGETVVLNNIFFDYDEYELLPSSKVELNRLIGLLKNNPEMEIRIQGHTDSQGDEEYNEKLSENRAKSVYNYLVEHGISEERLSYKGFGESQPIADNDTKEGRAKNRRTEFEVIRK
ncbi:MAG: OmpA family protein [Bacteroidales bacterium]